MKQLEENNMAVEIESNKQGRDFVMGDIHGNKEAFLTALKSVSFDKSKDRLFCAGDLVDGGEDSLFILSQLKEPWFYAVRGNHEQMLIDCVEKRLVAERVEAHNTHFYNGGSWWHELDEEFKDASYQLVSKLPYCMTLKTSLGDVGIVHGEVPKNIAIWSMLTRKLSGKFNEAFELQAIIETRQNAIWGRESITDGYDYFRGKFIHQDDQIQRSVTGIGVVVHGHTGVYEPVVWGNQIWMDTGGKTGKLTILKTEELFELVAQANKEVR